MTTTLLDNQMTSARRSIDALLAPLRELAGRSEFMQAYRYGAFQLDRNRYSLPCFIFTGQGGGTDPIRLAIFATIHGDEPAGALALAEFYRELVHEPTLAFGYQIYAYPLCNPTGYEDNTRHSRGGKDLNREFWKSSAEPEVLHLEDELWRHKFDGLISLHSDDTSDGLYGFVQGPDISQELLLPALWAAEKILPRNEQRIIDGFPANRGLIQQGYDGVLSAPPDAREVPFDLTFETPQVAPVHLQVKAYVAALKCILAEYRAIQATGQNI
ncbi:MAG: succinylglutamate desuccinylase/aspartoacylase family protein [Verrucomicrobiota bacterium]|jgi:murein peptide amidase A